MRKKMPFDEETLRRMLVLAWACIVAAAAQAARVFSSGSKTTPLRFFGGVVGAAIASFSFGAFALEVLGFSDMMTMASAGVVGWVGGDALAHMARWLEQRSGMKLNGKHHPDGHAKGGGSKDDR